MKSTQEILNSRKIFQAELFEDGGRGIIDMFRWQGTVIWSFGGGWEHVSVAPFKHKLIPSWEDMCRLKDIFFYETEWVMQLHPPASEYVNQMTNCLHLWRPVGGDMPTPLWWMVGLKKGKTALDAMREEELYAKRMRDAEFTEVKR